LGRTCLGFLDILLAELLFFYIFKIITLILILSKNNINKLILKIGVIQTAVSRRSPLLSLRPSPLSVSQPSPLLSSSLLGQF